MKLLPVLLLLAIPPSARAQQGLLGPGAAFISAGVSRISTGELDDRLTAQGYPTFGRSATSVGLGLYRVLSNRLLLGGEFNGLIIGEKPHAGDEVGLGGGYATLGAGYVFDLLPRMRIYPRVGLGAGGLGMWIETVGDSVDFDDVLTNPTPAPGRDPVLSRDGAVIDLGGGLEFLSRSTHGALIGIRLGYLFTSFGSGSSWQLYQQTARGGPAASIAGPYVRVVLGGAWSR